ncbi:MAG: hypothetical protein HUU54_04775 [Ignavibacteriaceae bacterium]|nr:hypothetical protein [Ignavibacteriaceae bacterium]
MPRSVKESNEDLKSVFEELKKVISPFTKKLKVTKDEKSGYTVNADYSEKYKREIFFGGIEIKKIYVSYYLFPVYMFPDLLKGISTELKKRMQGKSCFNFDRQDKALFAELKNLTKQGFEKMKKEGYIKV